MVRNCAHQTFEPKYSMDYRVLIILNESTLLLVTPIGKECLTDMNYVKPCNHVPHITVENACNTYLNSIKTNHPSHKCSLRLHD